MTLKEMREQVANEIARKQKWRSQVTREDWHGVHQVERERAARREDERQSHEMRKTKNARLLKKSLELVRMAREWDAKCTLEEAREDGKDDE